MLEERPHHLDRIQVCSGGRTVRGQSLSLVSLNLRLEDLLGPATRIKMEKGAWSVTSSVLRRFEIHDEKEAQRVQVCSRGRIVRGQ